MTTRTITGTYSAGYTLGASFSEVDVTATGSIGGVGLISQNGAYVVNSGRIRAVSVSSGVAMTAGGNLFNAMGAAIVGGQGSPSWFDIYHGGAGVDHFGVGQVVNRGVIDGGYGGSGGSHNDLGQGGYGGDGLDMHAYGAVVDSGAIQGGRGGQGGDSYASSNRGGTGGIGIALGAGGDINVDFGMVYGGQGGGGGWRGSYNELGGDGGRGIWLGNGGLISNTGGLIQGGLGGAANSRRADVGGAGGWGGLGVDVGEAGTLENNGTVIGGAGHKGGYGVVAGGYGGNGGTGASASRTGNIFNTGTIRGGAKGLGGSAGAAGHHGLDGKMGTGVYLSSGASVTNGSQSVKTALIDGGTGILTGYGAATVTNFGKISGENGGAAVMFTDAADTLIVEAGSRFVGAIVGALGTLDLATGSGSTTGFSYTGDVTVSGSMATTTFQDFGTLEIGALARFSLTGNGVVFAGRTLSVAGRLSVTNLNVIGSLALTGLLLGAGRSGPGVLELQGTATFDAGAVLQVAHVQLDGASASTLVKTNLGYAGQWIQNNGTVNVAPGHMLTFTGRLNTFVGTFAGGGQIVFQGGSDTLRNLTQTGGGAEHERRVGQPGRRDQPRRNSVDQ